MSKFKILAGIIALSALMALPLEALAQRGRGGRGGGTSFSFGDSGFSIGDGRSGVTIGDGGVTVGRGNEWRGYGQGYDNWNGRYDNYGRYGDRYYNNGYWDDGYYYNDGYYYTQPNVVYSQPTQQVTVAYRGPGVAIRNNADETLSFTIDGSRTMRIEPGETHRLTSKGQFMIAFDRGGDFGHARYNIREGTYEFTATDRGWELYRQKGDSSVVTNPVPRARTEVLRPQVEARTSERVEADVKPRLDDRPAEDLVPAPPMND